jgi:hypothetical protein
MINMQKLLYIVKELHIKGFEKLRIIPSLSPSGLSWRCSFISDTSERRTIISSSWIQSIFKVEEKNEYSIEQMTDLFEKEHFDFLNECKGKNKEYVEWYSDMLQKLKEGELPYAFSDYFGPTDYWETSEGQKISTLTNEKRYYVNS